MHQKKNIFEKYNFIPCKIACIFVKLTSSVEYFLVSIVVNPNWGKKRVCTGCSVRYYDLKNPSPVCPKCGTAAEIQFLTKSKKRSTEVIDQEVDLFEGMDIIDDDIEAVDSSIGDDFDDGLDIEVESDEEV